MARYAVSYFFLFCTIGVYAPWVPPFLAHRGLSPREVALGLALVSVSRALLPPIWGLVADKLRAKRAILVVTAFAAGAVLLALSLPGPPRGVLVWLFLYGFFLVPVLPLLETLTLEGLGDRSRYGPVRLWGSFGFIATALGLGALVPHTGISIVPFAAGLPLIVTGLCAMGLRRSRATVEPGRQTTLPWKTLLPVLIAAMLGQGSHAPYYAFFTLELAARQVPSWIIGSLWALGVIAEIVLMALSPRILPRIGLMRAMRWALVLTAVRWVVLATVDSLVVIAFAQLLHAASYAVVHLSTVQIFDQVTTPKSKAFAQTILAAGAYGIGIGGGLALAGQFVDGLGYGGLLIAASAMATLGLLTTSLARRFR